MPDAVSSEGPIDISVVVCTYNRAKSLQKTLESIRASAVPERLSWEVIVVDNNSEDNTKAIVDDFARRSGLAVVYAFEGKQGIRHARNRGMREAKGGIIAFIDDDVLVDKLWLENIMRLFRETDAVAAGGKILPLWAKTPPKWLREELHKFLALLDYGDERLRITEPKLWTANLAVRAPILRKYGGFDSACTLSRGEDVELIDTLLRNSEKIYYCPEMLAHHCIPEARMKKSYFRRWRYGYGEYRAQRMKAQGTPGAGRRLPLFAVSNLVKSLCMYLYVQLISPRDAFLKQLAFISNIGFVSGWMKSEGFRR
jgi:glycosyltransferase involved in cell wall biosynthesis